MKKTLLLLLFLPFLGFSQVDLVKWNASLGGNRNTPVYDNTILYPTASVADFTTAGVGTVTYDTSDAANPFFIIGNWPNAQQNEGGYDASKYIEFKITPTANRKLDLSTFSFTYKSQGGTTEKFQIQYSKDNTFSSNVKVLVPETISSTTWNTITPAFSPEISPVLPGEIVYVRVYVYNSSNNFHFRTGTSASNTPPVIKGTSSNFDSTKVLAINDYVSTKKELGINISPLSNDVKKENVTSITISTPPIASQGSAILNPDKTITFNPAKNFTGKATFKYTISDGTNPSSEGTVEINVSDSTPEGLVIWNAKTSTDLNKPTVNSPYVTAANVAGTGISAIGYNNSEDSSNPFYTTSGWPNTQDNGGSYNAAKYIEFKMTADASHKVDLSTFAFTYRAQGGTTQKIRINYSKSSTFSTDVRALLTETTTSTNWTTITPAFASDLNTLSAGESVYIRVYVYNTYDAFHFRTKTAINGTIKDVNTLTANNDDISTPVNQAVVIPILSNDVVGGSALQLITVTQPTNGTVTVNGTTSVTFTPSSSFTGTTSFTYTLKNAASNYSSATIGVLGTAAVCAASPTAGINYWKGSVYTYTGNTPATTTYVGSVAEKAIFDRNIADGTITGDSSVEADAFCGTVPSDKFFVRYLMKATTTAETYNITLGADDGVRLYIDGTLVTMAPTNSWSDHSYVAYSTQYTFTAGTHDFVLEYYENAGSSRVSFSYGAVKGDPTVYGDNKWNVYGYTLADISLPAASYAGNYVDNNLNINTQTFWNRTKSPSYTATWQGAPMNVDQFAITYKRQGFPCGRYQIQLVNCDDIGEIYVDGVKVYTQSGYTNTSTLINSGQQYSLNKNSKVEVRLREDAGDANLAINFIDVPFSYDGSTAPPTNSSIIINNDFTLTNDLEVCSCTVAAGKTLTIATDKVLTVNENVTVNSTGKIVVQNSGSLVQTNNASTYTGSTTSFELNRNTTPINRFDYTYWSSPVINQTLYNLSPTTLFDKYLEFDASANDWKYLNGGNYVMQPGKGYIIRGPQSYAAIGNPQIYQGKFIGVPNNGIITTPVTNKAGNTTTINLLGNPYPSALNADQFYADNSAVIKGTFYLWTHSITPVPNANGQFVYSDSSYISYNATGSTGAGDFTNCTTCGGTKLSGNIASGQGFFVEAKTTGNVVYNNALRVKTTASNNQFSKTAKTVVEKNRVWLNLKNNDGAYNEMLLGYITGATNELDDAYDGDTYASGTALYSILGENNLVIQGRALPFEEQKEIIPLGYMASTATEYTIGIESVDGLFSSKNVYLLDKTNNVVTNLSESRYTFTTKPGTFNDRFVLSFYKKTETIAPTEEPKPVDPVVTEPTTPVVTEPETPVVTQPETPVVTQPETPVVTQPETPVVTQPETPVVTEPETPVVTQPETPVVTEPETPVVTQPETPVVTQPETPVVTTPGGNPTPENPTLEVPTTPEITRKEIIIYQSNNQIMIESDLLNIESVYVYDVLGRNIFNKENVHTTSYTIDQLSIQHQVIIVKVRTEDSKIITKKVIF
ncbi:Ig-like domain-containing protein [Flavobacterium sp.]|uniref:Ig-like domain-containing protein n=1 Tax=Flavobacterium sp. TaxID=239 RepID=UPI00374DF0C0